MDQRSIPSLDYWMLNTIHTALQKEYDLHMRTSRIGKAYVIAEQKHGKELADKSLDEIRLNQFTILGNIYLSMKRIEAMREYITAEVKQG